MRRRHGEQAPLHRWRITQSEGHATGGTMEYFIQRTTKDLRLSVVASESILKPSGLRILFEV
jgi:hypothetical protein